jgi:hypothetical protein
VFISRTLAIFLIGALSGAEESHEELAFAMRVLGAHGCHTHCDGPVPVARLTPSPPEENGAVGLLTSSDNRAILLGTGSSSCGFTGILNPEEPPNCEYKYVKQFSRYYGCQIDVR